MSPQIYAPDTLLEDTRVLVVDNDPSVRDDHVMNLRRWGYEPVVAEGLGENLLLNAEEKARHYRCKLALVDMRQRDDHDYHDTSGLDLVSRLKPAISIIVSAYGTAPTIREALKSKGAFNFVGKDEGPEKLKQAIEEAIPAKHAREQRIIWPEGWSSAYIKERFFPDQPLISSDEADDVMSGLFPDAQKLALSLLNPSDEASTSSSQLSELFLAAQIDDREPIVVKMSSAQAIGREVEQYHRFVENLPGLSHYVRIRCSFERWDLGALVYDFPTIRLRDFRTFSQFYAEQESASILKVMEQLFDYLGVWLWDQTETDVSLFDSYLADIHKSLDSKTQPPASAEFAGQAQLPDPIAWTLRQYQAGALPKTRQAIAHGDLHGDNIYIDTDQAPWFLDFAQTGHSHILRDFVSLEIDILTHLSSIPADNPALFYELALAVTAPTHVDQPLQPTMGVLMHPAARKAFSVVTGLRELSYAHTGYISRQEYLWGLLLQAIRCLVSPTADRLQREQTRQFASIICARLEQWDAAQWPPLDWPPFEWATRAKQKARDICVRDLRAHLSRLESQLSVYERGEKPPPELTTHLETVRQELRALGEEVS
jgi:CheY-like chemotaxis protein